MSFHPRSLLYVPATSARMLASAGRRGADALVLDLEDAMGWLSSRIARYKIPRGLEMRQALPRDDNGKIAKRRLRAEFWEGHARKV